VKTPAAQELYSFSSVTMCVYLLYCMLMGMNKHEFNKKTTTETQACCY